MLNVLKDGIELYNPSKELYVFTYNDCGSVCVYNIDIDEALKLKNDTELMNEYWGACLGVGGSIYDDPMYEWFEDGETSNRDFCQQTYEGVWYDTRGWFGEIE